MRKIWSVAFRRYSVFQGVTCILPVLREGVLTGSPEQKEEAAKALGGVIKLTSPEALRPSVINITGPLIRILGDRFAWTVKTALLETLTLLLAKVCTCLSQWDKERCCSTLFASSDACSSFRWALPWSPSCPSCRPPFWKPCRTRAVQSGCGLQRLWANWFPFTPRWTHSSLSSSLPSATLRTLESGECS